MRVTLLTALPLAALAACAGPEDCRPPLPGAAIWQDLPDCPTGSIAGPGAGPDRDQRTRPGPGPAPGPEPEPQPEEPGDHWATRGNEPDSRRDPDAHRDWQRDRDAQIEEGTW